MTLGRVTFAVQGPPLAESERRDHIAADHVAEFMGAATAARGARHDHQGQKMLLARMAGARRRRLVPGGELLMKVRLFATLTRCDAAASMGRQRRAGKSTILKNGW